MRHQHVEWGISVYTNLPTKTTVSTNTTVGVPLMVCRQVLRYLFDTYDIRRCWIFRTSSRICH